MADAGGLLGIDLDNTVISYDRLLHRLAVETRLIEPGLPATKRDVRDAIRAAPGGEDRWQQLQGQVYGPRIGEAEPMPGVADALAELTRAGIRLAIVSHKTRLAAQGDGTDLREAALGWLAQRGLFAAGLRRDEVHFADSAAAKVARIGALGCRWFVDDMEDILTAPAFPAATERLLFAPAAVDAPAGVRCLSSWNDVIRHVLDRDV